MSFEDKTLLERRGILVTSESSYSIPQITATYRTAKILAVFVGCWRTRHQQPNGRPIAPHFDVYDL